MQTWIWARRRDCWTSAGGQDSGRRRVSARSWLRRGGEGLAVLDRAAPLLLNRAGLLSIGPLISGSAAALISASASAFISAAAVVSIAGLAGCGSPGTPQAPSLKLPVPPSDLTASRSGDLVTLRWTMPRRATDRVPLDGDQRAVICRRLDSASTACSQVSALLLAPGTAASYTDALPAELMSGSPRLLIYTVLLENHARRDGGPSNLAYTAAGASPPPIEDLRAEAGPGGIKLMWRPELAAGTARQPGPAAGTARQPGPAGGPGRHEATPDGISAVTSPAIPAYAIRLERTRIPVSGEHLAAKARAGVPQPMEQTLEVTEPGRAGSTLAQGWMLDHAMDQDAALNRTYRYTAVRVAHLTLDGHALEVSGPVSAPVSLAARDLFPPTIPQALEAVADEEGGAIDLSWTADADADLAGYAVYRRAEPAGNSGPVQPAQAVRISGPAPVSNAAWRDESVEAGLRYAYSVSAIDLSGNESARSTERVEILEKAGKVDKVPNR